MDKLVEVEKIVEKVIEVERIVEKVIEVERIIEVPAAPAAPAAAPANAVAALSVADGAHPILQSSRSEIDKRFEQAVRDTDELVKQAHASFRKMGHFDSGWLEDQVYFLLRDVAFGDDAT